LRDAVLVLKQGVEYLVAHHSSRPPERCSSPTVSNSPWDSIAQLFYKHLTESVFYGDERIVFNERGDRVSVSYDVLNKARKGHMRLVGSMV
jgi:hypothetical protein